MNTSDAAALLTVAAAFDNRKPDADTASAWATALDGLNPADCRDAILNHYRRSSEWLMPATVRKEVHRIRRERVERAGVLTVPAEIEAIADADEFDRAYRNWLGRATERVANGEPVELVAPARALTRRPMDSLTASLEKAHRLSGGGSE